MPLIQITQANSMDGERSAAVLSAVTRAYAAASGVPADKVWAIVTEVDREHWASGGTTLAAKDRGADR